MDEEELYRRAEDRAWRKSVQDDVDELATQVADLIELCRGDRSSRDGGLAGQVNDLETKLNSIFAIIHPGITGHGGLLQEHNELYNKVIHKERDAKEWLVFWAKVIGVIGGITTVALSSWPTLSAHWKETSKDMKTLQRQINNVKHPHVPRYNPSKEEDE